MKLSEFFFLFFFTLIVSCKAALPTTNQTESPVRITNARAQTIPFTAIDTPFFDFTNERLSVTFTAADHSMIQINGINQSITEVVYIRPQGDTIYRSNEQRYSTRIKTNTRTYKPGTPLRATLHTRIYLGDMHYKISIVIQGTIPEKNNIITNH